MSSYGVEKFLADLAYKKKGDRQSYLDQSIYKDQIKIHQGTSHADFFSAEDVLGEKHFNVHRGSKTQEDWLYTNTLLARNFLSDSSRFKRASQMSLHDADRYASSKTNDGLKKQVVEIGHSMGGTLAEQIAIQHNHQSVVFNQGTTPFRDYTNIDRSKHAHVRNKEDIVSMFDNNEKTIQVHSVNGNGLFPVSDLRTLLGGTNFTLYVAGSIYGAINGHKLNTFKQ